MVRFVIAAAVVAFASILLRRKLVTKLGKLSLVLCAVNALGWFTIISDLLEGGGGGHPQPFFVPFVLFGLLNLLLLPVAAIALWLSRRGRREKGWYVAAASAYVAVNILVLYAPLLILWLGWPRG
jgi:hypothetical protein